MRNGYLERQDEVVAKIKWRIAALEEARIEWVQQANESNSWNENGELTEACANEREQDGLRYALALLERTK